MPFWACSSGARSFSLDLQDAPKDALPVYVVAKQWMWKVQHPGGQREINELHIPVGHAVRLIMSSQDVIHSFFIPAFRIKHDVVPGTTAGDLVQAAQGPACFICSARNIAAPIIRA